MELEWYRNEIDMELACNWDGIADGIGLQLKWYLDGIGAVLK